MYVESDTGFGKCMYRIYKILYWFSLTDFFLFFFWIIIKKLLLYIIYLYIHSLTQLTMSIFASLLRPSLQQTLAAAKNIDDKFNAFTEQLAKELSLDIDVVKKAMNSAVTVFTEDEKKVIVCDGDDCKTKPKTPKEIDGKFYCSKCAKKAENKLKTLNKTSCCYITKTGTQCKNSATKGSFCSKHENSSSVIITKTEISVLNDFDFAKEAPLRLNTDAWIKPNINTAKMQGVSVKINKKSNVIITEENKIVGVFNLKTKKCIPQEELSNTVKQWIYDAGITIDYTPEKSDYEFDEDEETNDFEIDMN